MLNTCSSPCVKRHWSVKNKDIRIKRFPCSNSFTLTSFMHDTCERVRESEEKTKKKNKTHKVINDRKTTGGVKC